MWPALLLLLLSQWRHALATLKPVPAVLATHSHPTPAPLLPPPPLQEVKQIADIFLKDVFGRAMEKGIKIEVTEKFKDRCGGGGWWPRAPLCARRGVAACRAPLPPA